jgi:MoaA/NifB/PqqE/SkfB family radical SAM enzyme
VKSGTSEEGGQRGYFCSEPWTGIFSVRTNDDVVFCPCYLQMRIGNLRESSMEELWNSPHLVVLRAAFREGRLPKVCEGQLCPVALGDEPEDRTGRVSG